MPDRWPVPASRTWAENTTMRAWDRASRRATVPDLVLGNEEREALRHASKSTVVESPVPEADRADPQPEVRTLGRGAPRGGFPSAMGPAGLIAMQRLAGNQAMLGVLGRVSVQPVGLLDGSALQSDEETTGAVAGSSEKAPGPGGDGSAAGAPGGSSEPPASPGSAGGGGVPGGTGDKIAGMRGQASDAGAEGTGAEGPEGAGRNAAYAAGAASVSSGHAAGSEGAVPAGSEGAVPGGAEGVGSIAGQVAEATGKLGGVDHGVGAAGAGADDAGEGLAGPGAAGSEEIPAVAEPGDVAVNEIADLGQKPPDVAAEEVKEPEAPEHEEPKNLEAGASDIERHAQGGGGGIVDVVINRALSVFRGIASTIGNGVRGAASAISSRVGGFFSQAFSFAKNLVTTVTAGVRSIATGIATEIRTHLGSLKDGVKGIVSRVFASVRTAMGQVGGAIRGAIIAILSGQPVLPTLLAPFKAILGNLFGGITDQITAIINRIRGVVDAAISRVLQTVALLTQSIINGLTFLGNLLTTAVTFLQEELTRISNWVTQAVSGLPDMLRRVITAIVNAVISLARRVLNNIVTSARAFIARAIARVIAFVQGAIAIVTRIAAAVRNTVRTVFDLVAAGVRAVATAFNRVRTWLLGKAAAFVSRALRAVLDPIAERLKQRLLSLIGPAAGEAIRQAQLLFPNGLPAPVEVVQAAERGAQQAASEAGSAILAGLTNPEGDHIGFGIQLGGGGSIPGTPLGLSGSVSGMFDIVLDYRRNDIGFFLSPAGGGAASLGIGEGAAAGVGASAAWGTVATFGDASSDVLAAYGGWFTNASYGVSGGVADEIGVEASTGGSIYRGGSTPGIPVFSYTPVGADQHPVPGTGTAPVTIPGTTTPGTPDAPSTLALGEVRFPRQVSDVEAAPGGPGAVDTAATAVRDYPSSTPRGEVAGVDVLGEASRVWQRPRAGQTRAEENEALGAARARSVAGRLRGLIPGIPVTDHGNGDLRAASAGKSERDASPEDQRASMVASTVVRGTPGTTTPGTTIPGTPPTMAGQQHTFELGSLPDPIQARQTTGWDTTASVSGVVGAEAQVGLFGGLGFSYSIPLGKTHLDPATMHTIRIITGFMKLIGDVETLSPLGFIRDALGLSAAFPERDSVIAQMTSAVTDWTIPLPPGAALA